MPSFLLLLLLFLTYTCALTSSAATSSSGGITNSNRPFSAPQRRLQKQQRSIPKKCCSTTSLVAQRLSRGGDDGSEYDGASNIMVGSTTPNPSRLSSSLRSVFGRSGGISSSSRLQAETNYGGGDASSMEQKTTKNSSAWKTVNSYHLIWSPGFRKHLIIAVACLTSWHFFLSKLAFVSSLRDGSLSLLSFHHHHNHHCDSSSMATMQQQQPPNSVNLFATILNNVLLPLLSSACCLIQVIINVLVTAGGCAGFNTYLGPVRPYFLSLLMYMTVLQQQQLQRQILSVGNISGLALRFGIAFLPELLHIWNERGKLFKPLRKVSSSTIPGGSTIIEVDIPKMGCVACVNKIDNSIRNSISPKYLDEASSWLVSSETKGGRARVKLSSFATNEEINEMKETILQSVQNAGFGDGCKILTTTTTTDETRNDSFTNSTENQ